MIAGNDVEKRQEAENIVTRFDAMVSARGTLNRSLEELKEFLYPDNIKNAETMWDTTASEACIKLASILSSLVTPSGQIWHGLAKPVSAKEEVQRDERENKDIKIWLDDVTDTLFYHRDNPQSGFTGCMMAFYASVVENGTGCILVEEDENIEGVKEGISYIPLDMADVYFDVNHQKVIDTVFRKFEFTAKQIASKWGLDNLTDRMLAEYDKPNSDTKFNFIHAVFPKTVEEIYEDKKYGRKAKRFHSKFICKDENHIIEEGFFRTMPYAIGRFKARANEIYGRSPAIEALPSIRRLNEIVSELAEYSKLSIRPTYAVSSEMRNQGKIKFGAGEQNTGAMDQKGNVLIKKIDIGNPLDHEKEIHRISNNIRSMFMLDLFQVLDDKASRSAAESMEKTREKGAFISPIIGRLQAELIGTLVRRELDILDSQGLLPPLENISKPDFDIVRVVCTSPLLRFLHADKVANVLQFAQILNEEAMRSGSPEILDNLKMDEAYRYAGSHMDVPDYLIPTDEEIRNVRAKRAEAMKKAQDEQIAMQQQVEADKQSGGVARDILKEETKRSMRD